MNENFGMSDLKVAFVQLHEAYKTAQEAGFSKTEALQLCIAMLTAGAQQASKEDEDD